MNIERGGSSCGRSSPRCSIRVLVGLDRVGDVDPEAAQPRPHGLARDAEQLRGLALVAAGALESDGHQDAIDLAVGLRVDVARRGVDPVADEVLDVERAARGHRPRREVGQEHRMEHAAAAGVELGLERELHLADLVEQEGPAVALLELAAPPPVEPREPRAGPRSDRDRAAPR